MKKIAILIILVSSLVAIPAQAALIKFDVEEPILGINLFGLSSTLSGSFTLDTVAKTISQSTLVSTQSNFETGIAIDNSNGFGLGDTAFLFSGSKELLFQISGFKQLLPGLAVGDTITLNAFATKASVFNDVFQVLDLFDLNLTVFTGSVKATRLEEVAVNAPASMGMLFCLGLLAMCVSRSKLIS